MNLTGKLVLSNLRHLLTDVEKSRRYPADCQKNTLRQLLDRGKESAFGYEHELSSVVKNRYSYEEFCKKVPVRSYDDFLPYINRLRNGENYVLWDQKVKWFARSSGTSSGKSKYIPITDDSLYNCHYRGFKTLLASYLDLNPRSRLFSGKSMTLGGSISLDIVAEKGIKGYQSYSGDLSAILLKNSPWIAELKRVPKRETALLPLFEEKLDRICKECSKQNVTNFSGVPSWNLLMLNKLLEYNQVPDITKIWPDIELFMHGGINFGPYRTQYQTLIPKNDMYYLENYNASEGYFAFQDVLNDNGMLLTLTNGIFYEFIPMDELEKPPQEGEQKSEIRYNAIPIEEVKRGVTYAMVITTNSGLWRYLIGDCVRFTSTSPYKIEIAGRTQMYINTFGEELMIGNAEKALSAACRQCGLTAAEYTVAPVFMEKGRRGAHQWAIEFEEEITREKGENFAEVLDEELCKCNSDYEAKRTESRTMDRLKLTIVPKGTFYKWMDARGKIGGQNKVPRLSQDRKHIDELLTFIIE